MVTKTIEEALLLAKEVTGNNDLKVTDLKQDEDYWILGFLRHYGLYPFLMELLNLIMRKSVLLPNERSCYSARNFILLGGTYDFGYEYRGVRL